MLGAGEVHSHERHVKRSCLHKVRCTTTHCVFYLKKIFQWVATSWWLNALCTNRSCYFYFPYTNITKTKRVTNHLCRLWRAVKHFQSLAWLWRSFFVGLACTASFPFLITLQSEELAPYQRGFSGVAHVSRAECGVFFLSSFLRLLRVRVFADGTEGVLPVAENHPLACRRQLR